MDQRPITIRNRATGQEETERVFGEKALQFLYGDDIISKVFGAPLLHLVARFSFFSALYGWWQRCRFTRRKIAPFIERFQIDPSEFQQPIETFSSFNDFFIRTLKPSARPSAPGEDVAIIPADGRYLVFPEIDQSDGFVVKGESFTLETLLNDPTLAKQYGKGTMIISRLCPTDCHRFLFPCSGKPGETELINGWLYSVNPVAIKQDINIFTKNKRTLCRLQTAHFGQVLLMEVGATSVGSIHQTYTPHTPCQKGEEKGYFSFGASSLIHLFPPNTLQLEEDLIEASRSHQETRCLMGTRLGKSR